MIAADLDDSDSLEEEIMEAAERCGTLVFFIDGQRAADVGDIRLTMYTLQAGTDDNERGIIVRAELCGEDALIMDSAASAAETNKTGSFFRNAAAFK